VEPTESALADGTNFVTDSSDLGKPTLCKNRKGGATLTYASLKGWAPRLHGSVVMQPIQCVALPGIRFFAIRALRSAPGPRSDELALPPDDS